MRALTAMLNAYPTTYEEDSLLLRNTAELSENTRRAINLRRSEKGLLLEAREFVKSKWLDLIVKE